MRLDRSGRLERVALAQEPRQERETDVGVVEVVAPDQSADADGRAGRPRFHQVKAVTEAPIARDHPVLDVPGGVFNGTHAAVADVRDEGRVVQQLQHERRIARVEVPEVQPLRGQQQANDTRRRPGIRVSPHAGTAT